MIVIRPANESDLDWIIEELREFAKFYKTKKSLFGDESVLRVLLKNIMNKQIFLMAEKDGSPVGFIAGLLHPHFYNPQLKVLSHLFLWVVPGQRSVTKAAAMLIDTFTDFGKKNADWINFSMSPWSGLKKESFLKRGFSVNDQMYLMEV